MKIKRFVCNALQENAYVASEGNSCVIIDPGFAGAAPDSFPCEPFFGEHRKESGAADELDLLYSYLEAEGLSPEAILLTHSHPDHTLGVAALVERFGIPVYAAAAPAKPYSRLEDGATIYGFKVIATPGHTPDSVCFYNEAEHILFSGDTLFAGTIGRTDLPGGDYDTLMASIHNRLMRFDGQYEVLPGHGESSSIGKEAASNPMLGIED